MKHVGIGTELVFHRKNRQNCKHPIDDPEEQEAGDERQEQLVAEDIAKTFQEISDQPGKTDILRAWRPPGIRTSSWNRQLRMSSPERRKLIPSIRRAPSIPRNR